MFNPYEILGVKPDATHQEIKKAFRKLSKTYHPDKNNGQDGMFKNIAKAWGYLGTAENRAKYDNGDDMGINDPAREAIALIVPLFVDACENQAPDPIGKIKDYLNQNILVCEKAIAKTDVQIENLKLCILKITKDNKGFLQNGLENKIGLHNDGNKKNKKTLAIMKLSLDLCKDIEYLAEEEGITYINMGGISSMNWNSSTGSTF